MNFKVMKAYVIPTWCCLFNARVVSNFSSCFQFLQRLPGSRNYCVLLDCKRRIMNLKINLNKYDVVTYFNPYFNNKWILQMGRNSYGHQEITSAINAVPSCTIMPDIGCSYFLIHCNGNPGTRFFLAHSSLGKIQINQGSTLFRSQVNLSQSVS